MQIPIFQVDAFTNNVFGGNPAAICPLEKWLSDELLQKIAMENSVAETAFFVQKDNGFEIRWFTPEIEMDLCGHATLATAHVILNHLDYGLEKVNFYSKSGELSVKVDSDYLVLDLPSRKPKKETLPKVILDSFSVKPIEVLKSRDYVLVYESEDIISKMEVNQELLNTINLDPGGIVITAKGNKVDFVSRFFTPCASIFEDPVTGSAHCSLIPYWSEKLQKKSMTALQLSFRLGELKCEDLGNRVLIKGKAITYLEGKIFI